MDISILYMLIRQSNDMNDPRVLMDKWDQKAPIDDLMLLIETLAYECAVLGLHAYEQK